MTILRKSKNATITRASDGTEGCAAVPAKPGYFVDIKVCKTVLETDLYAASNYSVTTARTRALIAEIAASEIAAADAAAEAAAEAAIAEAEALAAWKASKVLFDTADTAGETLTLATATANTSAALAADLAQVSLAAVANTQAKAVILVSAQLYATEAINLANSTQDNDDVIAASEASELARIAASDYTAAAAAEVVAVNAAASAAVQASNAVTAYATAAATYADAVDAAAASNSTGDTEEIYILAAALAASSALEAATFLEAADTAMSEAQNSTDVAVLAAEVAAEQEAATLAVTDSILYPAIDYASGATWRVVSSADIRDLYFPCGSPYEPGEPVSQCLVHMFHYTALVTQQYLYRCIERISDSKYLTVGMLDGSAYLCVLTLGHSGEVPPELTELDNPEFCGDRRYTFRTKWTCIKEDNGLSTLVKEPSSLAEALDHAYMQEFIAYRDLNPGTEIPDGY